jgi:arsenical pump membrane protein
MNPAITVWTICGAATAGVILRPFRLPEAIWAVLGAGLLILIGALAPADALAAMAKGSDVYLFLIGMMLLAEAARIEGLFEWVAMQAACHSQGSPVRLFTLVFAAGVVVTTFLSNDATAVVMTPAVYAVARRAKADPLPLLFACALIANAASFVLPISNPANLVLYGGHMPPLGAWLAAFALPSIAAILATYAMLRVVERKRLTGTCTDDVQGGTLSRAQGIVLAAIVVTALLLMTLSLLDRPLGLGTCLSGIATAALTSALARRSPVKLVTGIAWSILPLVAGLFVLVEALARTGVTAMLATLLGRAIEAGEGMAAMGAGALLGLASNLTNNLPAGLVASEVVAQTHPPRIVTDALLIGVDLGPNLSITGSLATILWLAAIRREGEDVDFWRFLRVGALVMPPALILALLARLAIG